MAADFKIIGEVVLDAASVGATQRQIQNFSRNAVVKLKVDSAPLGHINADLAQFSKSLDAAASRTIAFTATTSALYGIGTAFKSIVSTFINVEAKLKSVEVILNATTSSFSKFKGELFNVARDTGKSFDEVADAALELSRQGLKTSEVLGRLNSAMILSRQSGLEANAAVSLLTAGINTFNREGLTHIQIINKMANVDSNFAVGQKDLADAISRAGSSAQDAGVSFDKLLALTTSLQQTTARGGAVIGNALKSIFTRVERSGTLEALQQFNVATQDLQGNVLSADRILQNLANTYKTLSTSEKSVITERVAGIQQINQLKALLGDLARANSVYNQSLAVSRGSTDEAIERNKLLNQTLLASLNAVKANAAQFASVAGKLAFAPVVNKVVGAADKTFGLFKETDQDSKTTGQKLGEGILSGLGSALSGPGLIVVASVLVNIFKGLGKFTFGVISDYSTLNGKTKEQANLQNAITQILASGNQHYIQRLAAARTLKQEEAAIRDIMVSQNALQLQAGAKFYNSTKNITEKRGRLSREGNFVLPRAAEGYLPINEEQNDINRGVGGASRAARPRVIPNFNFGGGKRGTVVANTDEYIVPNFNGGDGSAIFNQNMVRGHGLPQGARKINAAGGYVPNYALKDIYRGYMKDSKTYGLYGNRRPESKSQSDEIIENLNNKPFFGRSYLYDAIAEAGHLPGYTYSTSTSKKIATSFASNDQDVASAKIRILSQQGNERLKGRFDKKNADYSYNDYLINLASSKPFGVARRGSWDFESEIRVLDPQKLVKFNKSAAGGYMPNFANFPYKAAKYTLQGKKKNSLVEFIATKNASAGKRDIIDMDSIQKEYRMTMLANGEPVYHSTHGSIWEAIKEASSLARAKSSDGHFKIIDKKFIKASGGFLPNFAPNRDLQKAFTQQFYKAKRSLQPEEGFIKGNLTDAEFEFLHGDGKGYINQKRRKQFGDKFGADRLDFFNNLERIGGEGAVGTPGIFRGVRDISPTPTTVKGSINAITSRAPDDVTRRQLLRLSKEFDYQIDDKAHRSEYDGESHASFALRQKDILRQQKSKGYYQSTTPEELQFARRENVKHYLEQRKLRRADKSSDFLFRGVGIHEITNLRRLGQVTSLGESNADNKLGTFLTSSFGKAAGFGAATLKDSGQGYVLALDKARVLGRPTAESIFGTEEKNTIKAGRITKDDVLGIVDLKTRQIRSLEEFSRQLDSRSDSEIGKSLGIDLGQANSVDPVKYSKVLKAITRKRDFARTFPQLKETLKNPDQDILNTSTRGYSEGFVPSFASRIPSVNKLGAGLANEFSLIKGKNAFNQTKDNCLNIASNVAAKFGYKLPTDKKVVEELIFDQRSNNLFGGEKSRKSLAALVVRAGEKIGETHVSFKYKNKEFNFGPGAKDGFGVTEEIPLFGSKIPNFASPLQSAIKREQNAGIPLSQIRVENHPSLISSHNPRGLAVTNKIDEPGGINQGISRALSEGKNPKTYGASGGFLPNFARDKKGRFIKEPVANVGFSKIYEETKESGFSPFGGSYEAALKRSESKILPEISSAPGTALSSYEAAFKRSQAAVEKTNAALEQQKQKIQNIVVQMSGATANTAATFSQARTAKSVGIGGVNSPFDNLNFSDPYGVKNSQVGFSPTPTYRLPRFSADQQQSRNKKAEFLKYNRDRDKRKKQLFEQLSQEKNERVSIRELSTKERLISQVATNIAEEGNRGFWGGIGSTKRSGRFAQNILGGKEFGGLGANNKAAVESEVKNLLAAQKDRRGQKLQGAALGASFALPVLTGALISQLNPKDKFGRQLSAGVEGASTGLSVAASLGFTPLGLAVGGLTAVFFGLKGVTEKGRKSLEDYSEELQNAKGKVEEQKTNISGVFQGQDALKTAIESGASNKQIEQISEQIQGFIRGIEDAGLRNKVVNARTDDEKADILTEISARGSKSIAEKALSTNLEAIIGKNRGSLSDFRGDTQNILLKKDERNDLTSLVASSLQLKRNSKGDIDTNQLSDLDKLNKSGNFGLGELQKVLGKLDIDSDSLKKLEQLASIEREDIAKQVVERQLSVAALEKETKNIREFTSSLLRIGKSLEQIQSNVSFKFALQDTSNSGARNRAISGASQSLNAIGEFLSPEAKNRQENRIALKQIENERIGGLTQSSTEFVASIRTLKDSIAESLKGTEPGEDNGQRSALAGKSEQLTSLINGFELSVLKDPANAADTALNTVAGLGKIAKDLKDIAPNANRGVVEGINKENEKFLKQVNLIDAQTEQKKLLQEQTNKLNEQLIELKKHTGFLGNGNFESLKNLDLSKIATGSQTARLLKSEKDNPFRNRIFESRGNSFDDFFSGKKINRDAETERRSSTLGNLASGGLQAFQAGLFDGNKKLIDSTRNEVALAEESQIENQLNKLERIYQNSGDLEKLDQVRAQNTPENRAKIAATRAIAQIPIDGDVDKLGIKGPFAELSKNIINLDSNFALGVKGDFTRLSSEAASAAKALQSVSKAAELFDKVTKDQKKVESLQGRNTLVESLNDRKTRLEQLQGEKKKSFEQNLDTKFGNDKEFFGDNFKATNGEKGILGFKFSNPRDRFQIKDSRDFFTQKGTGSDFFAKQLGVDKYDQRADRALGFFNQAGDKDSAKQISRLDLVRKLTENYRSEIKENPEFFGKVVQSGLLSNQGNRALNIKTGTFSETQLNEGGKQIYDNLLGIFKEIQSFENDSSQKSIKELGDEISRLGTLNDATIGLKAFNDEILKTNLLFNTQGPTPSGEPLGKARGFIPQLSGGLLSSFRKEKSDIKNGVGGARPGDRPYVTNLAGLGTAVVNSGESIVRNFGGSGKDAVLNRQMLSGGLIPNYAEGTDEYLTKGMSDGGKLAYKTLAGDAQKLGKALTIIDKPTATINVFNSDGKRVINEPVLLGKQKGDYEPPGRAEYDIDSYTDKQKITRAGRLTSSRTGYDLYGNKGIEFKESNIAIHQTYTDDAKEKRLRRLATQSIEDNRISYGCINVAKKTIEKMLDLGAQLDNATTFIVPEKSLDTKKFLNLSEPKKPDKSLALDPEDIKSQLQKSQQLSFSRPDALSADNFGSYPTSRQNNLPSSFNVSPLDLDLKLKQSFGLAVPDFEEQKRLNLTRPDSLSADNFGSYSTPRTNNLPSSFGISSLDIKDNIKGVTNTPGHNLKKVAGGRSTPGYTGGTPQFGDRRPGQDGEDYFGVGPNGQNKWMTNMEYMTQKAVFARIDAQDAHNGNPVFDKGEYLPKKNLLADSYKDLKNHWSRRPMEQYPVSNNSNSPNGKDDYYSLAKIKERIEISNKAFNSFTPEEKRIHNNKLPRPFDNPDRTRTNGRLKDIQAALKEQEFYFGDVNGEESPESTAAIRRYQIRNGLEVTGKPLPGYDQPDGIYEGNKRIDLSDNRAAGIYENGKLIPGSGAASKRNNLTRPPSAYEQGLSDVRAVFAKGSRSLPTSAIPFNKYGAGYAQGGPTPVSSITSSPSKPYGDYPVSNLSGSFGGFANQKLFDAYSEGERKKRPDKNPIFGEDFKEKDSAFRNQFQGSDNYKEFEKDISVRNKSISDRGSFFKSNGGLGDSGGLGNNGGLQESQRFGGANLTPDDNERNARKTSRQDNTRFERNVGNSGVNNTQSISKAVADAITKGVEQAGRNNANKDKDNNKPAEANQGGVKVDHNIRVEIAGNIDTKNVDVKKIVDEEIAAFKQRTEARLAELERVNPNVKPIPPKVIPAAQ